MNNIETAANSPILVTGGTGTLGRLVVARLLDAGKRVRVLSRGKLAPIPELGQADANRVAYVTADLQTGDGVEAALEDTEVVVHLAGTAKGDEVKARNLVRAAKQAGVRHIVYISVAGADRLPVSTAVDRSMFAYFASKRAAEEVVEGSGVPWTMLRATQFDQSFFKLVSTMTKLPIAPVPSGWRFQPIDAAEVADRLVELTLGEPSGLVAEMGGRRAYDLADMVRSYLTATGRHRLIIGMPTPGGAARALRAGANLTPDHAVGRLTWEQYLADHVAPSRSTRPAESA